MKVAVLLPVLVAALVLPAAASGHPGHGAVGVGISLYSFSPSRIDVVAGDVVFWTWRGPDTDHTVTGRGPGKTFESDRGTPAAEVSHRAGDAFGEQFTTPGTYAYHCRRHPSMQGTVVVTADTGGGAPPVDRTAPEMIAVSLTPARMCRRCARPGGRLRFTLSETADLEGSVVRLRGNRRRTVRQVELSGRAGRNSVPFRVTGLTPGRYELRLRAYDDADNASKLARHPFTVR